MGFGVIGVLTPEDLGLPSVANFYKVDQTVNTKDGLAKITMGEAHQMSAKS